MRDGLNAVDIRRRTEHGLPLTSDQQRYVVQIAFGPLPPQRKRVKCPQCNGKGKYTINESQFVTVVHKCEACTDGRIWIEVPDTFPVRTCSKCACGNDLPMRCAECEIGDLLL